MEFPFDINYILPYEITIFNGDYRVLNKGLTTRIFGSEKLSAVIDAIGEASFKAQGLRGAVTTSRKFRASDQRLYIIKEAHLNNGLGAVIGILKVGEKHLYVYDTNGKVYERTPLCVLDFYVHESKQRLGYGKRLFDIMLEYENCASYELAIDRPSNKCIAFLRKHYNLTSPIYQVNNYVVYPAFFNASPPATLRKPSAARQRQESFTWLPSNEKQQRRPFSEIIETERPHVAKILPNANDLFGNHQQPMTARLASITDEHPPLSYRTLYNQHHSATGFFREYTQPTSHFSRTHSHIFDHDIPLPNLQRYNSSVLSNHSSSFVNGSHRTTELHPQAPKTESFASIFSFPSLVKSTNNWRQVQSTIDSSSSAWRIFGVE